MTADNIENKKIVIDFFKTIIGFAAGAIILIANFVSNIDDLKSLSCWFRVCVLIATVFFASSILFGLFAIKRKIEDGSTNKFIYLVIIPFGLGFVALCLGIYLFIKF